jgi:hypothetical protein
MVSARRSRAASMRPANERQRSSARRGTFRCVFLSDAGAHAHDGATMRFGDLLHLVRGGRSAWHYPDELLWFQTSRHAVFPASTRLTDITPTISAHFGVSQPPYMRGQPSPIY